jgi:hypothetical protein
MLTFQDLQQTLQEYQSITGEEANKYIWWPTRCNMPDPVTGKIENVVCYPKLHLNAAWETLDQSQREQAISNIKNIMTNHQLAIRNSGRYPEAAGTARTNAVTLSQRTLKRTNLKHRGAHRFSQYSYRSFREDVGSDVTAASIEEQEMVVRPWFRDNIFDAVDRAQNNVCRIPPKNRSEKTIYEHITDALEDCKKISQDPVLAKRRGWYSQKRRSFTFDTPAADIRPIYYNQLEDIVMDTNTRILRARPLTPAESKVREAIMEGLQDIVICIRAMKDETEYSRPYSRRKFDMITTYNAFRKWYTKVEEFEAYVNVNLPAYTEDQWDALSKADKEYVLNTLHDLYEEAIDISREEEEMSRKYSGRRFAYVAKDITREGKELLNDIKRFTNKLRNLPDAPYAIGEFSQAADFFYDGLNKISDWGWGRDEFSRNHRYTIRSEQAANDILNALNKAYEGARQLWLSARPVHQFIMDAWEQGGGTADETGVIFNKLQKNSKAIETRLYNFMNEIEEITAYTQRTKDAGSYSRKQYNRPTGITPEKVPAIEYEDVEELWDIFEEGELLEALSFCEDILSEYDISNDQRRVLSKLVNIIQEGLTFNRWSYKRTNIAKELVKELLNEETIDY